MGEYIHIYEQAGDSDSRKQTGTERGPGASRGCRRPRSLPGCCLCVSRGGLSPLSAQDTQLYGKSRYLNLPCSQLIPLSPSLCHALATLFRKNHPEWCSGRRTGEIGPSRAADCSFSQRFLLLLSEISCRDF